MNRKQQKAFRIFIWILGIFLTLYIAGRPLYWHLNETLNSTSSSFPSCPSCHCDCSLQPFLTLPEGTPYTFSSAFFPHKICELTINSILVIFSVYICADCMRLDPGVSEEVGKSFTDLLAKKVKQKEGEAEGKQRAADTILLEAKKMASQYQKEADKCNSGMDTCEEARERAEISLGNQIELTALWELRARQSGWKGASKKFRAPF
ncbi:hypothetical protein RJT34_14241 [Clitoria ternatea]|uniref:Uncharacterized protein n=1 Tax=Clitoria ternatea TaxID=43366 RepID=A0AAN9JQE8_CLITE